MSRFVLEQVEDLDHCRIQIFFGRRDSSRYAPVGFADIRVLTALQACTASNL